MKKIIAYTILAISTYSTAFAQKDSQAKAILNQVSQKYRSYDVIKTDFTFSLNNQQANIKETQTGTLISRAKTGKYRVTLYSAAAKPEVDKEILSDGKNQWTYLKKDKEVQVSDADKSGDGLNNPAQIFTMYEKGFKYLYTGEQKIAGKVYQNIELTPEDDKKAIFKVKLTIDKVKKQLYSALLFDKNGNRYTYTVRTFTPNVPAPDATFAWDAKGHPGVEVVDLR
ncbi:outer membrane lipoprotein-sorting protein [Mucilaginibacter sp. SG538B]|jgi:outer membrane lipoprotein-sorting protein|uniref:LolA family protein n=1 Tax=unclassified Mucilaginibacter TaxID=2617802 RepID=UPI00159E908F|nr:outer membrane lipoprotein carrier protein LolA [Mucilaginibacter sp. SG538B]NVM67053.1 outer membrane lipoprotein-sorting protein [Mucilaginibacter sp. SG538B]